MSAQEALMHFDPATGKGKPYPSHAAQWRDWHGRGFVIRDARPIAPFAYRGQLGWFDVPEIAGPDDPALFDEAMRAKAAA